MADQTVAYLGLGSNLGNRLHQLRRAVEELAARPEIQVRTCSSVYETEPVGLKDQPPFLNAVVEVYTGLDPYDLLTACRNIEARLGRRYTVPWGPREIDIDLLCYGQEVISMPGLRVPHPLLDRRRFVLVPFAEIAAEFVVPVWDRPVADLLRDCRDYSWVKLRYDPSALSAPEPNGNEPS